jgi:hypothetical protein
VGLGGSTDDEGYIITVRFVWLSCEEEVFAKCPTDVNSIITNKEIAIDNVIDFI